MTCPFLKEAQVRYCHTASLRKLIPMAQAARANEKCVSALYATCPVFRTQLLPAEPPSEPEATGACPYLRESLMQYCGAAPVTKLVPYSESLLSRCGSESFRYCELFLAMSHPGAPAVEVEGRAYAEVDGLPVPGWLQYSANHLWLDVNGDGGCHAGIDAFLSRALGKVDRISYVWLKGNHRPAAVITIDGADLEVVFPNPFLLTDCNLYLRADPGRLTSQPYTGGWLFEGVASPESTAGLLSGGQARQWMEQEQRRADEFLQRQYTHECRGACADGGEFAVSVLRTLDRERRLALFHEFFSPYASGSRQL
jgi:glycine cleavage system H lipoate-binding protein